MYGIVLSSVPWKCYDGTTEGPSRSGVPYPCHDHAPVPAAKSILPFFARYYQHVRSRGRGTRARTGSSWAWRDCPRWSRSREPASPQRGQARLNAVPTASAWTRQARGGWGGARGGERVGVRLQLPRTRSDASHARRYDMKPPFENPDAKTRSGSTQVRPCRISTMARVRLRRASPMPCMRTWEEDQRKAPR